MVSVCLLGPEPPGLSAFDVHRVEGPATLGDRDCDCVVAVADDPAGLAARLAGLATPAVLVTEAGVDADVALVRPGPGAGRALAARVRALAGAGERAAADGGVTARDPVERLDDGVVGLDREGAVTYLNGAAADLLDTSRERARGRALSDLGADGTVLSRAVAEATERGTVSAVEGRYGDRRLAVRAHPDEDGCSLLVRAADRHRRAREELAASGAAVRQVQGIVSDTSLASDEKLRRLLAAGRERLGVDVGVLSRVESGTWEAVEVSGDHPDLEAGTTVPLAETYCEQVVGNGPLAVLDATAERREQPAGERWGLSCYLGAPVGVDGEPYGTVCFADRSPRERAFTESETAFVELLAEWVRYVLELERERAFVEGVLDSLPDPLYAFDDRGRLVRWNDRLRSVTGYDAADLEGMDALEFVAPTDREEVAAELAAVREGSRMSVEAEIETAAGDRHPYELSGAPIREGGEVVGATGVARDISDQRARQEMLSGLLEATGSLMGGRDREEVAETVAAAAESVLGFDINVVRLYDREAGSLEPAAHTERTAAEMGDRPVYAVGEGVPGEVFASGEPRVLADATEVVDRGTVRSLLCHPMGVHGTISVGSTERDAFDETDQQVLALLATSAAAACTRAKREREVREAREHTETVLERVNGLVEDTVEVLVQAATREELAAGVVEQLAAAEPYASAWIGRPDVASETLSPETCAGDDGALADVTFDLTGEGPVATAYRTGEPVVIEDVASVGDLPWGAGMVIPLVYKGTTYGVAGVFADGAEALDERERAVLEALGRAVANAINAIERGRIMDATEIIELEFTVDDPDLLFGRLSRAGDCRVEATGTDYRSDGSLRLYLTAEGADGEQLAALARAEETVTEATVIVDHDGECLLELAVEDSILATLAEFGAAPREVVGEAGTTRLTVELPYEAEAREVFELVEDRYPSTSLAGYHERERPVETRQEFRAALADRFTDRQETALRTAYLGGFFEWPRDIDGNELAAAMDISRPTYHQHLRAAQRKVVEELFE